ncbi:2'-5' RNA ligase family protein [Rhizobium leguminosarum]|uniref:2'-5' RNA ligase family protein n=1 Tax=Rhizobium leguminosarum TaxID=384 RepID=UPI001F171FC8|nr:2'-5' RNA ligase family protein [Rhizobium leguminosarum]UIJ82960.1 2'-5' RNA ligase family protein [Rhizobium leguminosarum]
MIRTKVDLLWFKGCCAFHLQLFPDRETVSKLCALQDHIEGECNGPLLRVPATSLHMTVVTLIDAAAQFSMPNDEVWKLNGERWKETVERLVRQTPPIDLSFQEVQASEAAIFVKAPEPPELQRLRSAVSDAISFEDWRPKPPRIAHITLFRFSAEEQLPALPGDAGLLPIEGNVNALQLVKEKIYPSVEVDVLGQPSCLGASTS